MKVLRVFLRNSHNEVIAMKRDEKLVRGKESDSTTILENNLHLLREFSNLVCDPKERLLNQTSFFLKKTCLLGRDFIEMYLICNIPVHFCFNFPVLCLPSVLCNQKDSLVRCFNFHKHYRL